MTKTFKKTVPNHTEITTVFRLYEHPVTPEIVIILTFHIPTCQALTFRYPSKQEAYEIYLSEHQAH